MQRPATFDRIVMGVEMFVPQISGTPGTWSDVTPAGIDLSGASNGGDNYGVQDIWPDPVRTGVAYCWVCYQGLWVTTDFGLTWTKRSKAGGPLDFGKNWGCAISPDARTLWNTSGNNSNTQLGGEGRKRVMRSFDLGETWDGPSAVLVDPYNVAVNPSNYGLAIAPSHDDSVLYETSTHGVTWASAGTIVDGANTITESGYVHWVNSTTALAISQAGGSTGLFKGVRSGPLTWTWTHVSASIVHEHGAHQIYVDSLNDWVYVPCEGGIYRAQASGALTSFTQVLSGTPKGTVTGTATTLYSMRCFPEQASTTDPQIYTAPRATGGSGTWSSMSTPAGMGNGGKTLCAMSDGRRWVVLAGAWCDGIWRYVE